MTRKKSAKLEARFARARMLMAEGRHEEGVEELRKAIFDAVKMHPSAGKAQVEEILRFSKENNAFEEVEEILDQGSLRAYFFGEE